MVVVVAGLLWWKLQPWWFQWKVVRQTLRGHARPELQALWRGDIDAVRTALAGSRDQRDQFRLGCAELHLGNLSAALDAAERLDRDNPATRVLAELVKHRRATPTGSWLGALEGAWEASGRPDLRDNAWLDQDFEHSWDPGDAGAGLTRAEQMLWDRMTHKPSFVKRRLPTRLRSWAIDQRADDDVANLVIAASMLYNDPELEAQKRYRVFIARLFELAPESFAVRLARFTLHGRRGLGSRDLDELDAVIAAPDGDLGVTSEVFERFLSAARARGSASAEPLALAGTVNSLILFEPAVFRLIRSTPSANQEAVGARTRAIARRLLASHLTIGFALGAGLLAQAAALLDSDDLRWEASELMVDARRYVQLRELMQLDPALWPLPDLARECVALARENERGFYGRLLANAT